MSPSTRQRRVVQYLSRDGVIGAGEPEVFHTHAAIVFVGAKRALKIKRAVQLPYLDFSTLERRRTACLNEIEVNRNAAADLYLGVVPIIERPDGQLAIGGPGTTIEWAVEMRAFRQADLLSSLTANGAVGPTLAKSLGDVVFDMHARAEVRRATDPVAKAEAIIACIDEALTRPLTASTIADDAHRFATRARAALERSADLLRQRGRDGKIRRCHGDLHLANIVMSQGRPMPFDAIEFNDEFATIDVLYDLAFLLMDLDVAGATDAANVVLNRYLWRGGTTADLGGLAALPLFLAMRAGIRAVVSADRSRVAAADRADAAPPSHDVQRYLARANDYLLPRPARLVAVGGLSGSGKSTLAARLAPRLGAPPGALHLRSDLERKALAGVTETERLPPESYTRESSAIVYGRLAERAAAALAASHSVVVDAVFASPSERADLERVAASAGVPFAGLWLDAPLEVLRRRVAARSGDASDATVAVVERQSSSDTGAVSWFRIDASASPDAALHAALDHLAI
ncbi:MAG: AAA family ATPase [Hyphomicrobiaceae bacterium]